MGLQNFYTSINPLFFGLWKRGGPSHWGRDTIFESDSGNQVPRNRLDEGKIWAIGFDRWKEGHNTMHKGNKRGLLEHLIKQWNLETLNKGTWS